MTLWQRLFTSSDGDYIEGWTAQRAERAERDTFRYLGIRETAYQWSHRFRARAKLRQPVSFGRRKAS